MVELDEATRRALSQHYGPQPGSRAQVLANVRAQLGPPGGPDGSGSSGGSGPEAALEPVGSAASSAMTGQALWVAKVVGVTLGLTGAGLLALTLGARVLGADEQGPPPVAAAVMTSTEISQLPKVEPAPAPTAPQPAPSAVPAIEVADEHPPSVRRRAASKPEVVSSSAASTGEGDLAAELALIHAAQRLQARAPSDALEQLERHQRAFPQGQLAPEREVLRIELSCALDRREQARSLARAFSTTPADPRLRARVEASCAGTSSLRGGH